MADGPSKVFRMVHVYGVHRLVKRFLYRHVPLEKSLKSSRCVLLLREELGLSGCILGCNRDDWRAGCFGVELSSLFPPRRHLHQNNCSHSHRNRFHFCWADSYSLRRRRRQSVTRPHRHNNRIHRHLPRDKTNPREDALINKRKKVWWRYRNQRLLLLPSLLGHQLCKHMMPLEASWRCRELNPGPLAM